MRIRYALASVLVLLVVLVTAAAATTGFVASLNALQEVPVNASPATGTGVFVLDNSQTSLTYSVTFSGLVSGITASHIHRGVPGVNGSVIVPFALGAAAGLTSGSFSGTAAVTASTVISMIHDSTYANIHTGTFPGGEIRGPTHMDATPASKTTWGRVKALYTR